MCRAHIDFSASKTVKLDRIRHKDHLLPIRTADPRGHATPIFGSGDKFMAALTLSGAASRLEAARTSGDVVTKQLQAASELSRKLGASAALCERFYGVRCEGAA